MGTKDWLGQKCLQVKGSRYLVMVRVWCQGVQCSGELGTGSGSGHFPSGQRLFGHLVWLLGQGTISCSSQVCVESPLLLLGMGQDGAFTAGEVSHAQDRRDPKDTLGPCFGSCTAWRQLCSSCCSPGMQQLCKSCCPSLECSSCAAPATLQWNAAAVQLLPFTRMQQLCSPCPSLECSLLWHLQVTGLGMSQVLRWWHRLCPTLCRVQRVFVC